MNAYTKFQNLMAEKHYQLALDVADAEVKLGLDLVFWHHGRGLALSALGQSERALIAFNTAFSIRPNPETASSISTELRKMLRPEQALRYARDAYDLLKTSETAFNLAGTLEELNQCEEAIEVYSQFHNQPEHWAKMRFQRGMVRLSIERWKEGWEDYAHRFDAPPMQNFPRAHTYLPWLADIGQLDGRRLLVVGEQAMGEEILLATMIPDLMKHSTDFGISVSPRMVPTFKWMFPQLKIHSNALKDNVLHGYGCRTGLGEIGALLRSRSEDFPKRVEIALPDASIPAPLWLTLRDAVGVSWRSLGNKHHYKMKNVDREKWVTIFHTYAKKRPIVSFQYVSPGHEQEIEDDITFFRAHGINIQVLPEVQKAARDDIPAYATYASRLAGAIATSTTFTHVAGLVRIPTVLVLSRRFRHWYWHRSRTQSLWYPTVTQIVV